MSLPLHIAFIWHQHQPLYRSPMTGKYHLPWGRLHATKNYLHGVLYLERYPTLHQTVNMVPSLILQLEEYALGTGFDPYLELLLSPVSQLDVLQKAFILEHFFDARPPTMILPYDRYNTLWEQRHHWGIEGCLTRWLDQDFSDLLAWHNLVWFDPLLRERDREIQDWFSKGRNFTLSDRQLIYAKQRSIIAQILPQYRQMQQRGQLEIMTSPYTHPILPLLCDTHVGKVAVPDILLPGTRLRWDGDIMMQLARGKQIYHQHFYCDPQGLWPPELAVSPGVLPHVAKQGFRWLVSDESVLGWSLGHYFRRDPGGNLLCPHILYQPYRLEAIHGDLAIVFRDQRLSELLCSYSSLSPERAVADFLGHLLAIYQRYKGYGEQQRPWLVTIALQSETCWQNYPDSHQEFLETLYSQLTQSPWLKLVTVQEFITAYPPKDKIPPHQLHSGSWIEAGFTPWIGDCVKNRAWELLTETRHLLFNHPEATPENNPEAWESLYIAEGSDWFRGFGHGKPIANDPFLHDQLFREQLQGVYKALNEPIPVSLLFPLETHNPSMIESPRGFIQPIIDGKGGDYNWEGAHRIDINAIHGTMDRSSSIHRLWYGFDHFHFYLRLDFSSTVESELPNVHLLWFYPGRIHFISPVPLHHIPDQTPANYLFHHHLCIHSQSKQLSLFQAQPLHQWHPIPTQARMALQVCLEVVVPWHDLIPEPGIPTRLVVMLSQDGHFQMSLPNHSIIALEVP